VNLAVIGAGSWGTTYAKILADSGHQVTLYSRRAELADEINTHRRNSDYLPGITLPESITATSDLQSALSDAEQIYLAIPSNTLREFLVESRSMFGDALIVSLMKGLESQTQKRMSEVIAEVAEVDINRVVVLSGPNLALEIAQGQPAASVAACSNIDNAMSVAKASSNEYFTVFANEDVIGTELGGVLKNLIALALGIVSGVGHGQNTKASILTRGLSEITRFAVVLGARRRTMYGLAGLGDLVATGESNLSRNHRAGEMLGKGYSKREVLKLMRQTAEGLSSVQPVLSLAGEHNLSLPIIEQLSQVIDGKMPVAEFGNKLTHETEEAEIE
jgi:glycerol-3-phosphate dehydrogenase (NAD(P)+)